MVQKENVEKLKIHQAFNNEKTKEERFQMMIQSYDFDQILESMEYLNLSHSTKSLSNLAQEVENDRLYLDSLNKFLYQREARVMLNFDQLRAPKRKRQQFESQNESCILTNNERLHKLEQYFYEKRQKKLKLSQANQDNKSEESYHSHEDENDNRITIVTTGKKPEIKESKANNRKKIQTKTKSSSQMTLRSQSQKNKQA